ncbi:MAG TPA: response regulator, partial [Kofleriaceae bacterium]|nr:response regulator [Kofleriaceae bacterium]
MRTVFVCAPTTSPITAGSTTNVIGSVTSSGQRASHATLCWRGDRVRERLSALGASVAKCSSRERCSRVSRTATTSTPTIPAAISATETGGASCISCSALHPLRDRSTYPQGMASACQLVMRRVLVADDDLELLTEITEAVAQWGYAVDSACNGAELMEAMADRVFDLVITDISMPWMTGLQASHAARYAGLATPILVITALRDDAIA